MHLRLTEGMPFEDIGVVLEREFPDVNFADLKLPMGKAQDAESFARAYVGFNVWKSGVHGFKWDQNISRFIQTHRTEADNCHVRIRPDPIPGYPMEHPEPSAEEYERLHAEARRQHVEWRVRAGYYCTPLYEPCGDQCGACRK
jgi:hypothetical protein